MKITVLLFLLLVAASCSTEPIKEKKEKIEIENLIEYKDGIYTEFYPDKQKVKIRGAQDAEKIRDGKWVLLTPNGKEM